MTYPLGALVPLAITVKAADGTPTNTTPVVLTITRPDGTTETPTVNAAGSGVYTVDYAPSQPGRHIARWITGGVIVSAYADVFEVLGAVQQPLVGLADMKRHLNLARTTDDAELYEMGLAVSDAVESYVGFPLRRKVITESHDGGVDSLLLRQAPCPCSVCAPYRTLSITSVTEDGISLVTSDYVLDASSGMLRRGTYGRGFVWSGAAAQGLVVVYVSGYLMTPPWARLAVLRALANSWQSSQQRPHPGFGQGRDDDVPTTSTTPYVLPYAVQSLLSPHRQDGF